VDDAKELTDTPKVMGMLDQKEAGYTPVSIVPGKACSSCIWWRMDHCHIVANYPEAIVPNGYCNEHRIATPPNVEPILVVIVEPSMMEDDSMEMALPTTGKGLVEVIKSTLKSILNPDEPAFQVFKTKDGKRGWIARFTGKFIDREGEILADKAHDEYVERVQKGLVEPPELWMWHAKGTKHGQALTVWKSGGFVLAAGLFDATAEGERAYRYYQKQRGKIKLSHMFHYPKNAKLNGVYYAYNTVEITTLPDGAEAFPYTSFEELQTMALPEVAENMIREGLGEDALARAQAADNKAENDSKTLEGQGVASKGHDNYDGATIPADSDALKALALAQTDVDTRLKTAEDTVKALGDLPATVKTLQDAVHALTEQLTASQTAEAAALEKVNTLEAKWLEFTALKAPASQSNDTLLSDREKSLLDTVMQQAKRDDTPSLVEQMVGGQPTVSTQ
jgi:hypothetical protein